MKWKKIIEFWGDANLNRWSDDILQHVHLSPTSKAFLKEVGLPREIGATYKFAPLECDRIELPGYDDYYIIGYIDPVPICIEGDTGNVLFCDDEVNGNATFWNSSVEQLGICLMHYGQYGRECENAKEELHGSIVTKTRRKMKNADPEAFAVWEMGWPQIIQEMRFGFM